jgi:hypothetical protein
MFYKASKGAHMSRTVHFEGSKIRPPDTFSNTSKFCKRVCHLAEDWAYKGSARFYHAFLSKSIEGDKVLVQNKEKQSGGRHHFLQLEPDLSHLQRKTSATSSNSTLPR